MAIAEPQRLAALYERDILDTPPEERFDRVTRLARRLFNVDEALVNLIDRQRQWTKSTSDGPAEAGRNTPRADSFCTTTITEPAGVIVEDAKLDPRFRDNPHVTCEHPVRFYAGMPIAAPGGELVGTLCLVDHKPRRLSAADQELLRDLATWVEKELNLDNELDRAAAVQRALLPAGHPDDPRWDVAAACRPSRDVGGDFYDWYPVGSATAVILADVMGKGMPAAIVAAAARAALRAGADPSPAATLSHAAGLLATDLAATETFVTVFAATLHNDGLVYYADAGHGHAAVARRDGTIEPLKRGRAPIGLGAGGTSDGESPDHHIHLEAGDLLLIHSDGLLEFPFGPRSTEQLITRIGPCTSADDVLAGIGALADGISASDDLTAIAIRRPDREGTR